MEAVIGHPMGMQDSQSPARPVTLCVLLWANPGTASGLIAYEDKVLGIALEYGGRVIQRARNGGDDHALEVQNNIVHGSDSPESAEREIGIWFPDGLA